MPKRNSHQVRIIGGQHRGRKLTVLDKPGLRPTGDRIRETLFNWLQFAVPGADVLDLFAGSGALGFEACSREAASVTMVELDKAIVQQLKQHATSLNCLQTEIICARAEDFIRRCQQQFDIVFLDPPFSSALLTQVIENPLFADRLKQGCYIYIETERNKALKIPDDWILQKDKKAGAIAYQLYRVGN